MLGDAPTPEGVKVFAARVGELGAHLEPVGLQPVERAQHAVQAAQDGDVLLRPAQLRCGERLGVEPAVDVAVEGQRGLPGVAGIARGRPGRIARHIERGELVRQVHQVGDVLRRLVAQQPDQLRRRPAGAFEMGLRGGQRGGHRRVVVERFGGREQEQHPEIIASVLARRGAAACSSRRRRRPAWRQPAYAGKIAGLSPLPSTAPRRAVFPMSDTLPQPGLHSLSKSFEPAAIEAHWGPRGSGAATRRRATAARGSPGTARPPSRSSCRRPT